MSGRSSENGIIEATGRINKRTGIIDLSGYGKVGLYQKNRIQINDYHKKQRKNGNLTREEIKLVTPIKLEINKTKTIKTFNSYLIGPSDKELVLEIDLKDHSLNDLLLWHSCTKARYADGSRYPYVFPAGFRPDNKLIIYV